MNYIIAPVVALGMALSVGSFFTSDAFAKAHNQGIGDGSPNQDGVPGTNVGSETAGPAQGEGAEQGNGKGPADTPAGAEPGNSENAGRSGSESAGTSGGPSGR